MEGVCQNGKDFLFYCQKISPVELITKLGGLPSQPCNGKRFDK